MKQSFLFLLLALLLSSPEIKASEILKKWQVFEVELTAAKNYDNPYLLIPVNNKEGLVKAEFKGMSGNAKNKTIVVFGFWNGEKKWKIRFAAPETGEWEYKTISNDKGLNNVRGNFSVTDWSETEKNENPARRGFVQVMKTGEQAGHYFQYADGTPFLWISDTWWNWTNSNIKFSSFKDLVDDRASKGFNIGQLFVAANGWGRESSLLNETYTVPDIEHIKKVDSMIAYANSKGITVWIHGWWSREHLNETAGEEKIKRWWRYLIDRYAAYNVIWIMAGEYNMNNYGGFPLSFWKDLGQFIKDEDPYDRIVSVHNTPPGWEGGEDAPQWSTAEVLHNEKWLDYNQSQVGHGRWYNEMIPFVVSEAYQKTPAKPIVVTEPWYEFKEGSAPALDIRFGAWSAILSGGAGHTYGGGHVWLAYTPENPSEGGPWPLEKGFVKNTLDYPGAISISHLANFFKKIQWWNLSPHPDLLQEYPQKFCLAKPGNEYIVYLRYAGGIKVDLNPSSKDDTFEYYWFNPAAGKYYPAKIIKGGDIRYLSAPEGYPGTLEFKDWVLYIHKK
jgi:hypothetical protein